MINASDIIDDFRRFYSEGRGYIPATSGETWTQSKQEELAKTNETVKQYGSQWIGKKVDDCSGAFVDAYRTHGMSIYHGSNRIAREYVECLVPASEAKPGYAVFKIRKPGDTNYALPAEYKKGGSHYNGDLNDYYHIGLLDRDGENVINAQSTSKGFTKTSLSTWQYAAQLKAVRYDVESGGKEDGIPLYRAIVTADEGETVRMRKNPSTSSTVIEDVVVGETVDVMDVMDGWSEITYHGKHGYMMSKFLREIKLDDTDIPFDDEVINTDRAKLEEIKIALETAIGAAENALRMIDQLLGG